MLQMFTDRSKSVWHDFEHKMGKYIHVNCGRLIMAPQRYQVWEVSIVANKLRPQHSVGEDADLIPGLPQ